MTGEVVNLRRVRKEKARAEAAAKAAHNRAAFGRTKAERELKQAQEAAARRHLDGHKRDGALSDEA